MSERASWIKPYFADLILGGDVERSRAGKLWVAMTVPVPKQGDTAEVHALAYAKQCGGFAALNGALPEYRRFPGRNQSGRAKGLSCGFIAQDSGREIHDDGILDRHFTHRAHQDAFDPVVGKGERTAVVMFRHSI